MARLEDLRTWESELARPDVGLGKLDQADSVQEGVPRTSQNHEWVKPSKNQKHRGNP